MTYYSMRTKTPLARIGVTFHDDTLELGNHTVVARSHDGCCHLGDGEGNGFTLGAYQYHLVVCVDGGLKSKKS